MVNFNSGEQISNLFLPYFQLGKVILKVKKKHIYCVSNVLPVLAEWLYQRDNSERIIERNMYQSSSMRA